MESRNSFVLGVREQRFIRYSAIGIGTFLIDLALLYVLIKICGVGYLGATALAFFIAVSINYFLSRRLVFIKSERSVVLGYVYFLQWAGLGMALVSGGMWFLVSFFDAPVFPARISIAGIVGIVNYLGNLYLNFRVVGKSLR